MMLPATFAMLEPFAAQWAVDGSAARAELRGSATPEARMAFYEAMRPHLAGALDYLDGKGLDGMDSADARLLAMCMSLAHVALAIEQQQADEPRHTVLRSFLKITQAPAGA